MNGAIDLVPALLGALLLVALVAPRFVTAAGRGALAILALAPAGLAAVFITMLPAVVHGEAPHTRVPWIAGIGLAIDLRMDVLSAVMCLVICLLGAAVLAYSVRYFPPGDDGLPKYAGSLLAFTAAMLGLVLADNLILLVVCWELTGILSYLLIAHRVRKLASRQAASRALMVTTAGGLALLVGSVLLGVHAGTYTISHILADAPSDATTVTAVALMLVGGISKSAIVPFHFWLPGAMAAPTPASAYLHAATMVKAGIYLFARLAPAFATLDLWRPSLLWLGGITMVAAGVSALRQRDLKLLLAYGTVSQLGLMTMLTGIGTPAALLAAAAMLIGHATFKGALFFVVGIIDTSAGSRDIGQLSGVGRALPGVATLTIAAALSMAGLPPLVGFVAKEAGYASALDAGGTGVAAAIVMAAGSVLTVAYTARFCWGALATKRGVDPNPIRPRSWWMLAPTGFLVAAGLWLGVAPAPLDRLLSAGPSGTASATASGALALWHGWTMPLALTSLATVVGLAVFWAQRAAERRRARLAEPGREAGTSYRALTAGVDRLALRVTMGTQRGSLPVSLGAILLVLIVFPGIVLIRSGARASDVPWTAGPAQAVIVLVVIVVTVAVLRARQALAALLLVGGVGYAMSVLYVLRGAPDLALTQVLVETVTLIVAVLVVLRMPRTAMVTPPSGRVARSVRVGLALGVGALMTALALIIPAQRRARSALADQTSEIAARGGGHNIVNVILVDVRGWDTFGEISVLVAAVIGVSGLIFVRNPHARLRRGVALGVGPESLPAANPSPWLVTRASSRHSLLLEVATRLVFHMIIIFSLYVLFVGHNEPGGGFAGGLIAGIALTLRYLAGGRHELAEAAPVDAGVVMGLGLVVAAASASVGLVVGDPALTSWVWHADVPILGAVGLVSSTVFDIGVYLVVVGTILEVLRSVGAELDRQARRHQARARRRRARLLDDGVAR